MDGLLNVKLDDALSLTFTKQRLKTKKHGFARPHDRVTKEPEASQSAGTPDRCASGNPLQWTGADLALSTDAELLQAILYLVSADLDVGLVARALLVKFQTFGGVVHACERHLVAIDGIDKAVVMALRLVGASVLHLLRQRISTQPIIASDSSIRDYLIAKLQHERVEVACVLYFDSRHRLIMDEEIGRGTVDAVPLYIRELVRRCLELDASSIVIAHNHPSGDLQPSLLDLNTTRDVVAATHVFGITVQDHIIVGRGETLSLRARGLVDHPPAGRPSIT